MKKIISFLVGGMMLLSMCTSSSNKLVIEGHLTGLQVGDTVTVYVYDFDQQLVAGDTVAVTKKNRFYFAQTLAQTPYCARLYYFPAGATPTAQARALSRTLDLSSASDKLKIQGAAADFSHAPVSGGFYDDKEVKEYARQLDSAYKIIALVADSLRQAKRHNDTSLEATLDAEYLRLAEQLEDAEAAFVREHPSATYAAYLYVSLSRWETLKKVQEQYGAFSPELRQSVYGEMVKKNIDKRVVVAAGAQLPDFEVTDINGKRLSSADFKGKHLLLDFWGSWCFWCRKASPKLVKLYNEYKSKNLLVVGLAWDKNHDSWKKAIKDDGLLWTHVNLYDHQDVKDLFCISAFPTYIFVSPEGIILANSSNFDEDVEPVLRDAINN
ncbi:MAG: AhpC/TSA family protein [Prevotellaceae bacterium]|jgi:thiol-disulfide isomerase/thioredoxin|nr:AhpC/TSA family protein [Prevotellaceae bacterium]